MKTQKRILCGLLCVAVFCFGLPGFVFAEKNADGTQNSVSGNFRSEETVLEEKPGEEILEEGEEQTENREINGTVDLSGKSDEMQVLDNNGNGYTWEKDGDGYVLTLKDVCIRGDLQEGSEKTKVALIVPGDVLVTIKTEGNVSLEGGIKVGNTASGALNIVLDGAKLKIDGTIRNGVNGDKVAVQNGAEVEVTERFDLGSSGIDSYLMISGTGSILKIGTGEKVSDEILMPTTIAHLEVADGGMLYVESRITIISLDENLGSIQMDNNSRIEIYAKPTLLSENNITGGSVEGILDAIKNYLPVGYSIGIGKMEDGTEHYTILDGEGNIASSLILKLPVEGSTDPNPPETPDSPEKDPSETPDPSEKPDPTDPPEGPIIPGDSNNPETPETPEIPSTPEEANPSEIPGTSEDPNAPETPSVPETPDNSPKPTKPPTPTETPSTSGTSPTPTPEGSTSGSVSSGNQSGDSGSSDTSQPKKKKSSSGKSKTDSVTENGNNAQVRELAATPDTGDHESIAIWFFLVLCSAVVLSRFARFYKTHKN